jgi:hypothetical protein
MHDSLLSRCELENKLLSQQEEIRKKERQADKFAVWPTAA